MKQTLIVGFVLVVFCFADYAIAQQTLERAEAPVYKDGEWWEFNIEDSNYVKAAYSSAMLSGAYRISFSGEGFRTFDLNGQNIEDRLGMLYGMVG